MTEISTLLSGKEFLAWLYKIRILPHGVHSVEIRARLDEPFVQIRVDQMGTTALVGITGKEFLNQLYELGIVPYHAHFAEISASVSMAVKIVVAQQGTTDLMGLDIAPNWFGVE